MTDEFSTKTPPYLEGLNEAQKRAVLHTEGPLLVLAGAGSGKTKVITHRIIHLIHQGVEPRAILAVTFTNKAATEMRERVGNLVKQFFPSDRATFDSLPVVTTFHSLGVRVIREFHKELGLNRHFTIYDRSDSLKAIKAALEKADYNPKEFEPKKILNKISRAKGDAISISELKNNANSFFEQVVATVWERYENTLHQESALDFDDLLVKILYLLKNNPQVKETLQKRYRYLHIDEYQDTNAIQFNIAKLLASGHNNICVVGDVDQNIYSWRGANIKNILQFEKEFPGAKTILLEENYRSTKIIISASNNIIAKNRNRVEKTVFTNNSEGEKITLFSAVSGNDEAEYIAGKVNSLLKDGASPADFAVLYRTNFQSRSLEEAFLKENIPYQLLGTKFYDRKEIKDVLSYLKLALNPKSSADLARIINEPKRGIGKVTMLKVIEGKKEELSGAAATKVDNFFQIISDIADEARTKPLSETLKFIMKRTGIETELKKEGTEEDLSRLENLRELVTIGQRYDEIVDKEEAVEKFLEATSLQSDQDELKDKEELDATRLMTIHAAKGLEFPYVFICGLEEGLFPHERLDDSGIDTEEERRLFYVAITRASKKLFLTYAHIRTIYGSQKINLPSSFLNDIDQNLVESEDGKSSNQAFGGDFKSGYETTIYFD